MSFTITKTATALKKYFSLGGMEVSSSAESIDVIYNVEAVISITATNQCTVRYSMTSSTSTAPGYGYFEFSYSGTGDPLTEGETALQASLTATS